MTSAPARTRRPPWLPVSDAADEYDIALRTLQRWVKEGVVRGEKRRWDLWVNRASLEARLANRPKPGPKPGVARKEA